MKTAVFRVREGRKCSLHTHCEDTSNGDHSCELPLVRWVRLLLLEDSLSCVAGLETAAAYSGQRLEVGVHHLLHKADDVF